MWSLDIGAVFAIRDDTLICDQLILGAYICSSKHDQTSVLCYVRYGLRTSQLT